MCPILAPLIRVTDPLLARPNVALYPFSFCELFNSNLANYFWLLFPTHAQARLSTIPLVSAVRQEALSSLLSTLGVSSTLILAFTAPVMALFKLVSAASTLRL